MDAKRTIPRHIIIKMSKVKDKERILKVARERQRVTYLQRSTYKTISWLLKRNFAGKKGPARNIQSDVTDLKPRSFYPAKPSFRMEGQMNYFPDKVKLKEFIITKPLYEMLNGLI